MNKTELLGKLSADPEERLLLARALDKLELCRTRLPDNMHIPAEQIQVLTPTRKGPCGTVNLNRLLQDALNPRSWTGGVTFDYQF